MKIVPATTPRITRDQALARIAMAGIDRRKHPVVILGIRGYYRDTMGKKGVNDVGIYDDALIVVSEHTFAAFNGNVDPSRQKPRVAMLLPGVWWYKPGTHNLSKPKSRQYPAFVQADKVTVDRYKAGHDTGFFGINIHKGGVSTTSSLGCQTVYPTQWAAFYELAMSELKRAGVKRFPYILCEA